MKLQDILENINQPKVRKVKKERPDGSVSITYEVLNSKGETVKSGLSKDLAYAYLRDNRFNL